MFDFFSNRIGEEEIASLEEQLRSKDISYKDLSPELRKEERLAIAALHDIEGLDIDEVTIHFPDNIRKSRKVVEELVRIDPRYLFEMDLESFNSDRPFMEKLVAIDPRAGGSAHETLRADETFMRPVVLGHWTGLSSASVKLQDNTKFVTESVVNHPKSFMSASPRLRGGDELSKIALKDHPELLKYVMPPANGNPDVVRLIFKERNFVHMFYAADSLRDNPTFMLEAFAHNPHWAAYMSPDLEKDKVFARQAIAIDPRTYQYFAPNVRSDLSVALASIVRGFPNSSPLEHLPAYPRTEREFMEELVAIHPEALQYASPEIQNYKKIVKLAVSKSGAALQYASKKLQGDREIAGLAMQNGEEAVWHISLDLLADETFMADAVYDNVNVATTYRERVARLNASVSDPVREAQVAMETAMDLLEIDRTTPFNHSREIIRNRYLVADSNLKTSLERTLGAEYFEGVSRDQRPLAIVVYAESDPNNALSVGDPIDKITRGYQVIFYDVDRDDLAYDAIYEATIKQEMKADMLVIGAHGEKDFLYLGNLISFDQSGATNEWDYISEEDLYAWQGLEPALKKGGTVILESCFTGKDADRTGGADNVAEAMHSIWPHATLFAPQEQMSTNGIVTDENGIMVHPGFIDDNRYTPDEKILVLRPAPNTP